MKVALELQPCCGKRSGIGMYTYELAKRMRDRDGLEFCGNLFNFAGRNDNTQALQGIGMPIRESTVFPYGVYRRIWNWVRIPYQSLLPGRTDLTVFFNYIVPPHVSGKVITTIYDMTYMRFPETMDARNLRRLRQGIQYSVERSDHILTISEFSKQEIVSLLNIPEERISVVYSAPSLSGKTKAFEEISQKFSIRKPFVLSVGTIEPRKNLERLIEAFKTLKKEHRISHQLVLAGGSGWENKTIYQAAQELQVAGEIIFTGYLSEEEKNTLYKNADLFVFPSLYEGFGMPPLEAMAFGCPVVCADAASLPEVVGDAAELVDPLDTDSIADGMWRVLSDREYAAELRQKGYQQKEKFTWDDSAEKLIEIYRTVLGEP